MNSLWQFLHYFTYAAWIGGALAVLVADGALRRLDRPLWGAVAEVQAAIYRILVGPGAIVSAASGLMLTFGMYGILSVQVGPWLGTMQATGVLGTLVTLLVAMPAASRLARLEPVGETAAAFDQVHRRLALGNAAGLLLALLALLAGALYR